MLKNLIPVCNILSYMRLGVVFSAFLAICLIACSPPEDTHVPSLVYNDVDAVKLTFDRLEDMHHLMYADEFAARPVEGDTLTLWLTHYGLSAQADSLLQRLQTVSDEGISPETFGLNELQTYRDSLASWMSTGSDYLLPDSIAADIEVAFTTALMRYAYGQRYGYVLPNKIFNHLLVDADAPASAGRRYRHLFDLNCDVPTDSLAYVAVNSVREEALGGFLADIQPTGKLHQSLSKEYKRAVAQDDTVRARLARINLERSRWRYQRPDTGNYIFVNLAPQMLWAVDAHRDSCIEMKVCCGNLSHKSPLLTSSVPYMEFNPYWVVPQTIIRNEIAKLHVNDSAYFARNRMFAVHNTRKDTVNPTFISASEWRSGTYTLKQDKGKGNSLGRIIFRFPNKFSVYLHDTNQPSAFQRDNRAVSHGCIRVQRPMDLAEFMLGPNADSKYIDRIRLSIDLPPLTPEGRRLKEQDPEPLKRHNFKSPFALWIDYYTLYPDRKGHLQAYPDPYGYDEVLDHALSPL